MLIKSIIRFLIRCYYKLSCILGRKVLKIESCICTAAKTDSIYPECITQFLLNMSRPWCPAKFIFVLLDLESTEILMEEKTFRSRELGFDGSIIKLRCSNRASFCVQ